MESRGNERSVQIVFVGPYSGQNCYTCSVIIGVLEEPPGDALFAANRIAIEKLTEVIIFVAEASINRMFAQERRPLIQES